MPVTFLSRLLRRLPPVMALAWLSPAPAASPAAWEAGLNLDFAQAYRQLEQTEPTPAALDRHDLARAALLLVRPPRTPAQLRQAETLLTATLDRPDVSDPERATALYLRARLRHRHLDPADREGAGRDYATLRLLADQPALAAQGTYHLVLMRLEEAEDEAALDAVLTLGESWLAEVRDPAGRRDLHLLLGRLYWEERRQAAAALQHWRQARAIGHRQAARDADLNLMIAHLAEELGDPDLAVIHYRDFLHLRPRDARATTLRHRLAQLSGEGTP